MRLEKELVRRILLAIEASDASPYDGVALEIDGWTQEQIAYHVMLLAEANYLIAEDLGGIGDDLAWEAQRLTYAGHEFLDTIRDAEVWRRTKDAAGKMGGVSLQVMVEIGKAFAKQVIAERTGIVLT